MAEPAKSLIFTNIPTISYNRSTRSATLSCVEGLTGQEYEIQLGSLACESTLAMLSLFQHQYGPFVVDEPTPPTGASKH